MRLRLIIATGLGALFMPAAVAQAGGFSPESLLLDSHNPDGSQFSGPVRTEQTISGGQYVAVSVRGTYALYTKKLMERPSRPYVLCGGSAATAPFLPSPGVADTAPGFDAEFIFRRPFVGGCPYKLPIAGGMFEVNVGGGWVHPEAVGKPQVPDAAHTYRYLLRGVGGTVGFRLRDAFTGDNDGVLAIDVRSPTAAECGAIAECVGSATEAPPSAAAPLASSVFGLTAPRSCASRRRFTVHLRTPKSDRVVAATVRVNGRTVKVLKRQRGRARFISTIDLRGLPAGSVRVSIVARTTSNKVVRTERRYKTCVRRSASTSVRA
jgi:hypothetical protein